MTNLYQASRQWAVRPEDERFWTLEDAHQAALDLRQASVEKQCVPFSGLLVEQDGANLTLTTPQVGRLRLGFWSTGQLCQRTGVPAGYVRTLPTWLAAVNLNHGIQHRTDAPQANLLYFNHDRNALRAFTSDEYVRVWNTDVLSRCLDLEARGWRVPPARPADHIGHLARPATEGDVLRSRQSGFGGRSINVGDMIAPAGIYVSEHDMFVFLISEARIEDGSEGGVSRGVFITNSEVGAASLRITRFMFRHVCGNHIVWDVSNVMELRLRHVGSVARRAWHGLEMELRQYLDQSPSGDEARIRSAKCLILGQTKDDLLDRIFGTAKLSRRTLEVAYESVQPEVDGDARSAWGFAQGLTRYSQTIAHQDERDKIDRAAGRILRLAA